jgi:hypothetical protein
MKGCRALTLGEVVRVVRRFVEPMPSPIGCSLSLWSRDGLSDRMSLRVGDVWRHGRFVDDVVIHRRHMTQKRGELKVCLR